MNLKEFSKALAKLEGKNKRVFHYPSANIILTANKMIEKIQKITTNMTAQNKSEVEIKIQIEMMLEHYYFIDDDIKVKSRKLVEKFLDTKIKEKKN